MSIRSSQIHTTTTGKLQRKLENPKEEWAKIVKAQNAKLAREDSKGCRQSQRTSKEPQE